MVYILITKHAVHALLNSRGVRLVTYIGYTNVHFLNYILFWK